MTDTPDATNLNDELLKARVWLAMACGEATKNKSSRDAVRYAEAYALLSKPERSSANSAANAA